MMIKKKMKKYNQPQTDNYNNNKSNIIKPIWRWLIKHMRALCRRSKKKNRHSKQNLLFALLSVCASSAVILCHFVGVCICNYDYYFVHLWIVWLVWKECASLSQYSICIATIYISINVLFLFFYNMFFFFGSF